MTSLDRVEAVRAPTQDELSIAGAAEALGPAASLAQTEATAKFVFAGVAAVGAVVSGVSLLTGVGAALERGPDVFGVPLLIALLAASLVLATAAALPSLTKINHDDPGAVDRFFTRQIARRGVCASAAMILLAASFVAAADVAADAEPSDEVVLSAVVADAGRAVDVTASASVGGLQNGDLLVLRVTAERTRGQRGVICRASIAADSRGQAKLACPKSSVRRALVVVTGVVDRNGKELDAPERLRLAP